MRSKYGNIEGTSAAFTPTWYWSGNTTVCVTGNTSLAGVQ